MHRSDTTVVRIFTHGDIPKATDVVAQVGAAAASRGLEVIVINTENDPRLAIDIGVVALPAVIVERNGFEVARRECLRDGRGLRRWLDRRLVPVVAAPVFEPTFA